MSPFLICTFIVLIIIILLIFIFPFFAVPTPMTNMEPLGRDSPQMEELLTLRKIEDSNLMTVTHQDLPGDMGNNMFQIAALIGSGVKVELPSKILLLPINELFDFSETQKSVGGTPLMVKKTSDPIESRINVIYEYENYRPLTLDMKPGLNNIRGYRQCYKYFDHVKKQINQIFTPKQHYIDAVMKNDIFTKPYIALHIRRGDYNKFIHNFDLLKEFKKCEYAYFREGIKLIRSHPEHSHLKDAPIIVCTNSPNDVDLSQISIDDISFAPSFTNASQDKISGKYTDFVVLYLANALVISNSTYSWWAAYLQYSPSIPASGPATDRLKEKLVICPSPWWDPRGFVGKALGLDGPYLHYPSWWLLDPEDGKLIRRPFSLEGEKPDISTDVPRFFKYLRGSLV